MQFEASLRGHVGLPRWLDLFQPNLYSPAYLYGTAPASNETLVVMVWREGEREGGREGERERDLILQLNISQIYALRKDTFNSKAKELNLKIESPKGN